MLALLLTCGTGATAERLVIGIVSDDDGVRQSRLALMNHDRVINELQTLLGDEYAIKVPADRVMYTAADRDAAEQALARLLADSRIDLVLAVGIIAGDVALSSRRLGKPVIAPYVTELQLDPLPAPGAGSGQPNLHYLTPIGDFEDSLQRFEDLVQATRVAVLVQREIIEQVPGIAQRAQQAAQDLFLDLEVVAVGEDWQRAIANLDPGVQGVVIAPLPHLDVPQFRALSEALMARNLPSFSMNGVAEVELGIFAGTTPERDATRMARRIALNVERILRGARPEELPVRFDARQRLTFNMATGRRIRRWPSWQVMAEAELLNLEPQRVEQRWSLSSAIHQAFAANLDLRAADLGVAAGAATVQSARADLFPQLSASLVGQRIDADRASASAGALDRHATAAELALSQTLFSERVRASWDVAQLQQVARLENREIRRQDIATETAIAYLNVLSARRSEQIEQQNLRITQANLQRAEVRESIGYSGPGEVYRLQSELATARQRLLDVQAARYQGEMALNRLLHQPLETRFELEETDFSEETLVVADLRFFEYVRDPQTFAVFRNFVVEHGLEASPELAALDAERGVQSRLRTAAGRAFWLPEVELRAGVSEELTATRSGSPLPMPGDTANDTEWQISLNASLPLYTGGRRQAERARASRTERQLLVRLEALAERVEQNIRSALQDSAASFAGIRLAEDAKLAAQRNLELVTAGYERGAVSLVDLIDAQSAALAADQRSANAVYRFLRDHIRVQRAAGMVDLFIDPALHEAWFVQLDAYFKEHQDDVAFP